MVVTDTLEGTINRTLWYHYALGEDVLYLRLLDQRSAETVGEETSEGLLLLRRVDNDEPVGLTIVHCWKRFGSSAEPDSIRELERCIAACAQAFSARSSLSK